MVSVYAPRMERSEEEKDSFWEELKGFIKTCEDRGKALVIGDMNVRVGGSKVESVVGRVGVSEVNENGRKLIELCTKKKLSVGNTFIGKKDIHKFTWVSGVDDRKSLLDFIVVQEEDRNKL